MNVYFRDSVPWNFWCTKDPRWLNNIFLFSTEILAEQLKKHPAFSHQRSILSCCLSKIILVFKSLSITQIQHPIVSFFDVIVVYFAFKCFFLISVKYYSLQLMTRHIKESCRFIAMLTSGDNYDTDLIPYEDEEDDWDGRGMVTMALSMMVMLPHLENCDEIKIFWAARVDCLPSG